MIIKIITTLGIMFGSLFLVLLYFYLFSLFLKDDEKCLTIPYGFCFFGLIVVLVMSFLEIYNSL